MRVLVKLGFKKDRTLQGAFGNTFIYKLVP